MNNYERRQAAIRILRELQSLDLRPPLRHPSVMAGNSLGDIAMAREAEVSQHVASVALFQLQQAGANERQGLSWTDKLPTPQSA